MLRDPAFFWRPNNTASRRRGGEKNRSATKFRKNYSQEGNFLNSFVQDCSLCVEINDPYKVLWSALLWSLFSDKKGWLTQGLQAEVHGISTWWSSGSQKLNIAWYVCWGCRQILQLFFLFLKFVVVRKRGFYIRKLLLPLHNLVKLSD